MSSPFKTFIKFSIGTWINAGISIISIPIITWFLNPEELGKATMFTLAYNLLLNVFLLGQDQSYARHYNDTDVEQRAKLLSESLSLSVIFTILCLLIIEIFRDEICLLLFQSNEQVQYVDLLTLVLLLGVLSRFALLIIRMKNKALIYSFLQVSLTATNLLSTILYAVFIKNDFTAVIISFAIANLLCLVLAIYFEYETWIRVFRIRLKKEKIKAHLGYGLPFVPTFLFDWLFQSSDRTFLRIYSSFSQIGIYATATRISSSLNIIQTGFNTFWVPFVFEKYSKDPADKSFYQLVFEAIYLTFSVLILLILLGKGVLFYLLPSGYHSSIDLFPLLLFIPMLYTISEITGVGINLKKKTVYHLYILLAAALSSVLLGYFLIRPLGARGAIITNFCSYCVFFILRSVLGGNLYRLGLNWRKFLVTFVLIFTPILDSFLRPGSNSSIIPIISIICILIFHRDFLQKLLLKADDFRKQNY